MLVTLLLLGLPITYAATTIISSSDPSISLSPGWSQQYSQSTQDLYMQTNFLDATLSATLPSYATSVSYVGYKRAGGSLYGYCIDCEDTEVWMLQTANASDPTVTDDDTAVESTMFTIDLDPSTQHTLMVVNLPDSQFNDYSINLDHLFVEVEDNATGGNGSTTVTDPTANSTTLTSMPGIAPPTSPSSTATTSTTTSTDGPGPTMTLPMLPVSPSTTAGTANGTAGTENGTSGAGNGTPGTTNKASSSGVASKSSGLSKSVITGISVLSIVFGLSLVVGLVAFLRQRQQKRRNSFQSSQPSPTASIIPIMPPPPPDMRTASSNPFSDPSPRPLESPVRSTLMQRRMESRNASPGSAPTIPLPELPLDRPVNRMESRTNSPATSHAKSDLWIARPVQTPLKSQFSV
ncbi:hypothetical protein B0H11DRAFT_2285429 [Mycena galericulata]|nr:hypothetical protein B0H11DRAFT_2285429 [Mycena galericulata]